MRTEILPESELMGYLIIIYVIKSLIIFASNLISNSNEIKENKMFIKNENLKEANSKT
jgi:hypothetical protein